MKKILVFALLSVSTLSQTSDNPRSEGSKIPTGYVHRPRPGMNITGSSFAVKEQRAQSFKDHDTISQAAALQVLAAQLERAEEGDYRLIREAQPKPSRK